MTAKLLPCWPSLASMRTLDGRGKVGGRQTGVGEDGDRVVPWVSWHGKGGGVRVLLLDLILTPIPGLLELVQVHLAGAGPSSSI